MVGHYERIMPVPRAIDVHHLGTPQVVCCHEIDGFIVDPGPESAVSNCSRRSATSGLARSS